MTLGQAQRAFVPAVAELVRWAYANGFELSFGEAFRTVQQAAWNAKAGSGIANSLHVRRLAIDLNVFKDGTYLTLSEQYAPLGEYWKTLHPLARWGGDFKKPDGNHFSFTWEGVS